MNQTRSMARRAPKHGLRSSSPGSHGFLELFPESNGKAAEKSFHTKRGTKSDFVVVSTRSSIKQLYDVISAFDEKKKELVRSTGFGGILSFPPLRQINRRFAVWLMSRVDPRSQTLDINDSMRIKFNKSDVQRVFGIPCGGTRISDHGVPRKEVVNKIMCGFLGSTSKDNRSIKSVQEVLQRVCLNGMSVYEENAFKVAFVIYVMSTLLCPGAKYDYVSAEYWNALIDPGQIHGFDWSEYVIKRLFAAVVKVKSELKASNKVPNVTGCSLFLQVLYLDSIDTGFLNLEHKKLPRIMDFSPDTMKPMILADTICGPGDIDDCEFGKSQIRAPQGICYSWASEGVTTGIVDSGNGQRELWKVATSLSQRLGVHMEVAGPVFFAVAEFEAETTRIVSHTVTRFTSVLGALIEPYRNGFRYSIGRQFSFSCDGGCATHRYCDAMEKCCRCHRFYTSEHEYCCAHMKCCSSPHYSGHLRDGEPVRKKAKSGGTVCCEASNARWCRNCSVDSATAGANFNDAFQVDREHELYPAFFEREMVVRVMARFYLVFRCMNCVKHMNPECSGTCLIEHQMYTERSQVYDHVKKPWDLGGCRDIKCLDNGSTEFKNLLDLLATLDGSKLAISVDYPRHLQVSVADLISQMSGGSEFGMDLFDAITRRFKQHDDALYTGKLIGRWRHYFESGLLESILAGYFDISDPVLLEWFVGRHIGYNLSNCRMFFYPGILEHRWVCYAWNLDANKIYIFDPLPPGLFDESVHCIHAYVVAKLKHVMRFAAENFFDSWSHEWDAVEFEVLQSTTLDTRTNKSGLGCAQFCLGFDCCLGGPDIEYDYSEGLVYSLISDTLAMDGNKRIPNVM